MLSDTHVAADRKRVNRDVNMAENLAAVIDQVLSGGARPGNLVVCGDLALGKGEPGDYAILLDLLAPVAKHALPTHLLLGNHDHRDNFWGAIANKLPNDRPLESKHVAIVESPRANWFMLDSLEVVNATPGMIGEVQLAWLTAALDARKDKPAIIVVHHNPQSAAQGKIAGIKDSDQLMSVLSPRRNVKAMFFGHTHHWNRTEQDGIHLINLPPVAYLFVNGDPNGWVEGNVRDNGMSLTLHTLSKQHSQRGSQTQLEWRTDRG